jgi:hypothetical protein
MYAYLGKALRYLELVLHRERYASALRTIAKRCVI